MATALEQIAEKERTAQLTKNSYSKEKEYNTTNINALSNGDEKGKGEYNNEVGSLTDINTRKENMVKNTYTKEKEYNTSNPNALSSGDEKGKGEYNGEIGSSIDISTRTETITKNKYGSNKTYPDFTI